MVKLTDATYYINLKEVPAILAFRDIEWEEKNSNKPCRMRKSLEELGYIVKPPLPKERGIAV